MSKLTREPDLETLTKLANFLLTIPEKERKDASNLKIFDMNLWCNVRDSETGTPHSPRGITIQPFGGNFECGFAGCAIGWGIWAKIITNMYFDDNGDPCYRDSTGYVFMGIPAVMYGLGLSYAEAQELFGLGSSDTRIEVACDIEEFVRKKRESANGTLPAQDNPTA